ncbi:uncharacterized protein [Ptychodera flava]|uniref:uncharacterized protein n=1 Tax=Ptychodera flava TaxID=63121 RepID=UPI00396A396E
MDEVDEALAVMMTTAVAYYVTEKRRKKNRKRRLWCKPWLLRRQQQGWYQNLIQELRDEDPKCYRNFLRVNHSGFMDLLSLIEGKIAKMDTTMRPAVSPGERLAVTLRYLATGQSYQCLQYGFRISVSTIRQIIPETCEAIYQALKEDYLTTSNTTEDWLNVAREFEQRWNFPHCIGALDGKHVVIRQPSNSGSTYYNYKHTFSIVLMALVDANYKFSYVDVGCQGRISDGGVYRACSLSSALESNDLNLPEPTYLSGTSVKLPYMIVADDAFPIKEYLMKPYPHRNLPLERRVFNYRLSRARRVVENAFGILASRFRVFLAPINLPPETVEVVVLACCALHNYLMSHSTANSVYTPPGSTDIVDPVTHDILDGSWRNESGRMMSLQRHPPSRGTEGANHVRNTLCEYFNNEGAVGWQ